MKYDDRITIRVHPSLKKELADLADAKRTTMNTVMTLALEIYLRQEKPKYNLK